MDNSDDKPIEKVFLSHSETLHETWSISKDFYDLVKCQARVLRIARNRIDIKFPEVEGTLTVIAEDIQDVKKAENDEFFRTKLVASKKSLIEKCGSFCKHTKICPKFISAINIVKAMSNPE